MPSELERLQAEVDAAPESAPEAEKPFLTQASEAATALGNGILTAVPGGQWAAAKLAGALPGGSEQGAAQEQARLANEYPISNGVGVAGSLLAGMFTGSTEAEAAGWAAKALGVGKTAAQAAVLQPAYKLGEVANQAQGQGTPLYKEQIEHALIPDFDTLKAAGIAGALHLVGLSATEGLKGLQSKAGDFAAKSAAKLFPKATRELELPAGGAIDVGKVALDTGALRYPQKIDELQRDAGNVMGAQAAKTPVDQVLQNKLSKTIDDSVASGGVNTNTAAAARVLQEQSSALLSKPLSGSEVEDVIQGIRSKARKTSDHQERRMYNDAAYMLREHFADHMENIEAGAGAKYRDAADRYGIYAKMADEAAAGAAKQATGKDLALAAAGAAAPKLAYAVGGPAAGYMVGAAEAALVAAGKTPISNKSYALLLDRFNKYPPLATFIDKSEKTLNSVLGNPSARFSAMMNRSPKDVDKYYQEVTDASRAALASPQQLTANLANQLSFLPAHHADAITASVTAKLQDAAAQIPQPAQPPTLFGQQTGPTDREKRDYLAKFDAKFDPYKAIMSGNPDIIAEADKYHPETMHELRKQLIERCAQKNVPYSTRRQISAILGVACSPTQDPALGAQLQTAIQKARRADTHRGQMDSARQQNAMLKNNQKTLTQANSLAAAQSE